MVKKIIIDLNVVLDILENRQPYEKYSSMLIDSYLKKQVKLFFPAHGITTIHYIVAKHGGNSNAQKAISWILQHFTITTLKQKTFQTAQQFQMKDFEDAVLISTAVETKIQYIATRNLKDFQHSPIPAHTPEQLLAIL